MTVSVTVVGGIYRERCMQPHWDAVVGSAGRAAQTIAGIVPGRKRLVSYVGERVADEVAFMAGLVDFELEAVSVPFLVTFDYTHTLANPMISPPVGRISQQRPLSVYDDVVLRYGMLEGDAVVSAKIAVYDPQSAFGAVSFTANGSVAKRLAIVLNRLELESMTGLSDPVAAANWLFENDGAEVVVLKMGAKGALVMTKEQTTTVPLYHSDRVWKLGSGDVFSSTFAALWAVQGMLPHRAADLASRAVSWYCAHRTLPPPDIASLVQMVTVPVIPGAGQIYLAAPFFDLGQRWLVEEARRALLHCGAEVFSPVHEIGPGSAEIVAPADLAGLENCDVLVAILNGMDPGTLFEAGYACKLGIPVIVLAENVKPEDLKMLAGTGAIITDDFVTAMYQAIWKLP